MIFKIGSETRFKRRGAGAYDPDVSFRGSGSKNVKAKPCFVETAALDFGQVYGADDTCEDDAVDMLVLILIAFMIRHLQKSQAKDEHETNLLPFRYLNFEQKHSRQNNAIKIGENAQCTSKLRDPLCLLWRCAFEFSVIFEVHSEPLGF